MYLKFLRKEIILPCVILTLNNINYLFVRVYVWFWICIDFNENPVNQKEAVLYSIKLRDYGENLKCHAHTFSEKVSSIKVCKKTLQLKCRTNHFLFKCLKFASEIWYMTSKWRNWSKKYSLFYETITIIKSQCSYRGFYIYCKC